ncbi:MAG: [NiFe]-hydrogenase assembly chaperone HybE [Steroidobacteraceae bacterium]
MNATFEGSYLGDGSKLGDDARLECGICWWVYDPALGDEATLVAPGTPFTRLPDHWRCPNCDAEKSKFMVLGLAGTASPLSHPVERLAAAYRRAALAMKGMPIYNPTVAVEPVGFREHEGRHVGVVVTPWFMNLTVIPSEHEAAAWQAGGTVRLVFPSGLYDLLVGYVPDFGLVGTCPLFSAMTEFTDHEAAQVAALAAAEGLFEPEEAGSAPVSRRQLLGG